MAKNCIDYLFIHRYIIFFHIDKFSIASTVHSPNLTSTLYSVYDTEEFFNKPPVTGDQGWPVVPLRPEERPQRDGQPRHLPQEEDQPPQVPG